MNRIGNDINRQSIQKMPVCRVTNTRKWAITVNEEKYVECKK